MYKPDVSLQETERKKAPNRPKTKKTRRKFPADIEDGVVIKKKKKPVSGKPLTTCLRNSWKTVCKRKVVVLHKCLPDMHSFALMICHTAATIRELVIRV